MTVRLTSYVPAWLELAVACVLAAAACSHVANSYASLVKPTTLETRVHLAKMIFAGTVSDLQYGTREQVGTVTTVRFRDVRSAKGSASDGMELTIWGGRVPERRNGKDVTLVSVLEGLPAFEVGSRYIVFAASLGTPDDGFVPIVALGDGVFRIHQSQPGGPQVVHDALDRPLTSATNRGIAVVDARAPRHRRKTTQASDTIRYVQPGEVKPNPSSRSKPLGRLVGVERKSRNEVVGVVNTADSIEVLRVLSPSADTGTRITEQEFLSLVRRVALGR